jgi:hypothetical protein
MNSAHTHPHEHVSAETYPHVHGGPPVLDIGGDVGALVATMEPAAAGTELHLRSEHEPPISIHTGVWHRAGQDQPTAAVFAELREGTYHVLAPGGGTLASVDIVGGALTTVDLRGGPSMGQISRP